MRRLSYSLGSLLSIDEVLECSRKLNEIKPEAVSYTHLTLPTNREV